MANLWLLMVLAAAVEILFHVAPGAFHPRPAVTSTVFRLTPRAQPLAPVRDRDGRLDLMEAALARRCARRDELLEQPLATDHTGPGG